MAGNLLDNASATGQAIQLAGGTYAVVGSGTFNGATMQLQLRGPDGSTFIDIASATLTANGSFIVDLPACTVKMAVSGGTPSALYANIAEVG